MVKFRPVTDSLPWQNITRPPIPIFPTAKPSSWMSVRGRGTSFSRVMELTKQSFLIPLDPVVAAKILDSPPFVSVDGAGNFRDLGNLFVQQRTSILNGNSRYMTRPGRVFRSAQLSYLRPKGQEKLHSLGIKSIFDFRSSYEITAYGTQIDIPGITVHHVPIMSEDYFSPQAAGKREEVYETKLEGGLLEEYQTFLDNAGPSFGTVFRHMRDNPEEAIIVHCARKPCSSGMCIYGSQSLQ